MTVKRTRCVGSILAVGFAALFAGAGAAAEKDPAPEELKPAWSLEGQWTGVVGDETDDVIYSLGSAGKCFELDSAGKTRREFANPKAVGSLRLANWHGNGGRALLAFGAWGEELQAFDLEGKPLWSYRGGEAINDVWTTDLHGDKSGDVIVGYNAGDGLHVLDSKGQLHWKSTAIANVWHVSAGDVWGEGDVAGRCYFRRRKGPCFWERWQEK